VEREFLCYFTCFFGVCRVEVRRIEPETVDLSSPSLPGRHSFWHSLRKISTGGYGLDFPSRRGRFFFYFGPTINVLNSLQDLFYIYDRCGVLLYSDVLCAYTFWREEMAGLKQYTSRRFLETHRQS
jgi:hypothetical protein